MKLNKICSTLFTLALASSLAIGCAEMSDVDGDLGNVEKILGGKNTKAPQWMTSLQYNGQHFCGGTLIHKNWILTAAHCVDWLPKSEISVCVGRTKISGCRSQDTSGVSRVIMHKKYSEANLLGGHDIALLKLKKSFSNRDLSPLARRSDEPRSGKKVRAIGWGVSDYSKNDPTPDHLQRAGFPFLNNQDCADAWGDLDSSLVCIQPQGDAGEIADKSACSGDSGGPIHFNGIQLGVASFVSVTGDRECSADAPNAFTRVSSFLGWIRNKTNGDVNVR